MLKPLQPGDMIGVVSPASLAKAEDLERFQKLAEARGFRVRIFGAEDEPLGRMAAEDERRAAHLMAAFADPEIDAVVCARGGYGSARTIKHLHLLWMSPKPFVGYSDNTALALHLNARLGMPVFHGPMATDIAAKGDEMSADWLFDVLTGSRLDYRLEKGEFRLQRAGEAEGIVFGGNVSTFESLIGTESFLMPEGAILMLEDVGEFMYSFDRSLVHFAQAGLFKRASGVIISDLKLKDAFSRDNSLGLLLEEVLEHHFADFAGPVVFDLPCGHTQRQMTLPIGARARLSVSEEAFSLRYEDFWGQGARKRLAA